MSSDVGLTYSGQTVTSACAWFNVRLIRTGSPGRPPRLSLTQLLNSDSWAGDVEFNVLGGWIVISGSVLLYVHRHHMAHQLGRGAQDGHLDSH